MASPATPRSGGLPMLVGYSCVHVGKSLLWAGEDALTLYILVRFLALPPALAGTIFLISALWNAICDGMIGAALHRSARMQRWMPMLTVPAILTSALGFAALPFAAGHSAGAAAAILLLFRTGFSLADVPHNGLTRLLAAGGRHLQAARIRAIGSASAALAIGIVCVVMLNLHGDARLTLIALASGVAAVALVLMAPLPFLLAADQGTGGCIAPEQEPGPLGQRPLWIYCAATAIGLAGLGATAKAVLHLDFVTSGIGPAALLIATAGRLGAIWVWSPVAMRMGNRTGLALAYSACGLSALCLPWLAGTQGIGAAAILTVFGVAGGGVAMLSWAVLTETIARAHAPAGSGFAAGFGIFTMTMKIGLGLSAILVGGWLSASGTGGRVDPAGFWSLSIAAATSCGLAAAIIALPGRARPSSARLRLLAMPTTDVRQEAA